MIGIIVSVALTVWFVQTARSVGKNPWAWAAIALAAYYIPVFLWGFVLAALIPSLGIRISSGGGAVAFGLAIGLSSVVVGVLSALSVRRKLLTGGAVASGQGTSGSAE